MVGRNRAQVSYFRLAWHISLFQNLILNIIFPEHRFYILDIIQILLPWNTDEDSSGLTGCDSQSSPWSKAFSGNILPEGDPHIICRDYRMLWDVMVFLGFSRIRFHDNNDLSLAGYTSVPTRFGLQEVEVL